MRKSFTRLLSLVMLLGFVCFSTYGVPPIPVTTLGNATNVLPVGLTALTKTTDKAMVIYSENVVASTGFFRLSNSTTNSLVRVIPATDSRVSFAKGDTVEIDFSADLKEFTEYSVLVDASAVKAADGTPAAYGSTTEWGWKTGDYTAPTLKSVVPVAGAVVTTNTINLVMTFEDNEAVVLGTGKVALYRADGHLWDLVDVTTNGTLAASVLTLTGVRALEDNVNYHVTIDAGVVTDNGLRADAKKNVYAGLTNRATWTFSSKDFTIPAFATDYPKKGVVGTTTAAILVKAKEVGTAYAYFVADGAAAPTAATIRTLGTSVAVTAVDTEFAINLTGMGVAATSADFDVYVIIENADVAAVDTDAVKVDIKTSENTAPLFNAGAGAGVKYYKGTTLKTSGTVTTNVVTTAAAVAQDIDNIMLAFDEEVQIGSGNIIIRKAADNSDYMTINSSKLARQTDKKVVKVPVTKFENNASYYVLIPNTIILDLNGNAYQGMSSTVAWKFTTNDIVGPTFTYTPIEGAANVKKDANIVLTFNEPMHALPTFNITDAFTTGFNPFIVKVDGTEVAFSVGTLENDGKFTTYTIDPTANYTSSSVVTVQIRANSLGDVGNNVVDPQGQGIAFVVEDYQGPVLTYTTLPTTANKSVVATFDEPVYLIGGGEINAANLWTILTVKETDASGANVPYTATIENNKKITITPSSPWTSEKTYYVAITSSLEDIAGNDFSGFGRAQTFTILDNTPATVDLSSVDGKTISTTAAVTLIFKEGSAVEGRSSLYFNSMWNAYTLADMTKVIVLKEGSATGPDVPFTVTNGGDAATFGIVASLAGNNTYYVGVGASTKGADGNVNVAKFVTFTTKFEGVPTISSRVPADNAPQIDKASSFVLTYNTGVQLAGYTTGDIYITDGVTPINITSGEISFSSDGKTVTINPSADLANDKSYDIVVAAGVFANKNLLTSVTAAIALNSWDFFTKDTQLVVQTLTPDATTGVAIDAKLVLTFNEKVIRNLGFIDIKSDLTDALIERIDIVSSQVVLSNGDKTVTITPSAKFSYNTAYYVEVSAGVLQDAVANKTEAIFGKISAAAVSNWTFTTANPALAIVKVTPKDGTDKVAADAPIVIEFNREIASLTGEVGYIEFKGGLQQTQLFAFGSTNVTISGKTLTIMHPTKPFPADAEIFLYIPNQVISAATDATIKNTLLNQTLFTPPFATEPISFFTGDVNPPVPTFSPVAFDSGNPVYIPVDANITITFDEDIFNFDGTSITIADVTSGGLFSILDGSMAPVNFTGSISGKTVTLDPTSNLDQFTTYTIQVNANKIEDSKGQTITAAITSQFKTQDTTAPTVAFTLTGGNKKITLGVVTVTDLNNNKFYYLNRVKSDAAAPTAAEIKAANNKDASSGTVAGFDISNLSASTTYQLFYVADDNKGNTSAVAVKEASTDDTVAPLLVSTTPAADAMDVNVTTGGDIVVKLTFNEKVSAGAGAAIAGEITVRDYATQAVLFTLSRANLTVILTDDKSLNLTIPGFNAAAAPVKMYVEIASGTITDQSLAPSGVNAYAGAFGMNTIVFTTEDNELPAVIAGQSTIGNVNLDTNFEVYFSENVKAGTGNLVLYKGAVAAANAVQVFTASEAVFSGNRATLNPSADLDNGQVYVVGVEAGFAKDLSANANGNAVNTGITFTGSLNVRPFVNLALMSPLYAGTPIAKALLATIDVTFNENIYLSVAGYSKSLTLLTQAELLAHISVKNSAGTALAITQIIKTGANSFRISTDAAKFADESNYTVNVNGFQDNLGLVMNDFVYNYTTADGTPPVITFSPKYKDTSVIPQNNLTLTFSENIYDKSIVANNNIFSYVDNSNVKSFVYLREGTNAGPDVAFTATISGRVITIDPTDNLKSGVRYYYGMLRTVEDIGAQPIVLNVEPTTYVYFDAADYTAPMLNTPITVANYAPLGTGIAANAAMSVIFNEDVKVSTGFVVIRHEDGTIFQMVSGSGLSIDSANKKKLKIAHDNFEPYTNYFVEIGASTVVDNSGNANAMFNDPTPANGWLFTTNDTYALTATVTPTGENTPRSVNLEMLFNKAPIGQAGKFISVYKADGTAVIEVPATSVVINGNKAMIPVTLAANQAYYAQVEADAFKDASNNAFAGIMDQSWVFSTVNNISPKLVAVSPLSPANNAINVEQVMTFTANFDRPIAAGTGLISIRHKTDGSIYTEVNVTDASNVSITGTLLTFSLPIALEKNTSYYVLIPAGAVTNTEITKDVYAGIDNTYEWTFSTGSDDVAPTLVSKSPNTPTNLKANEVSLVGTFSEKIAAGTGKLLIYNAADDTMVEGIVITPAMVSGTKITVAPTALMVSTSYYVLVEAGAVKDLTGNDFAGLTDKTAWKFSTGDYTGPTLEVTDPVVPVKTVFTVGLKFSEAVTGVLGGITVTNGNFEIEPVLGGKEYILTVSAKEQTLVTIVLSDAIKDMSANSNKFAGQTLTYTTGDFTKPQMVTWTPYDETIANNHPTFKMTFNENVVLGTGGNLVVYKVATTTPVMTIPLTAAMISGKDVTVSYVYNATTGGLDKDTRYYVLVDATALKDNAGNAFAGVSNVSDWTFKTGSEFATLDQVVNGSLFKVYPNPFDGFVNVDNASELSKVIVTNIAGQTVKVVIKPAGTIQLNELRSGVYFISLYNMDNVIAKTAKIVKR